MFISQTTTRRTANKTYRSVRLVESRRVGRKVQQKTLLNLGAHFAIPKAQWAELVEIIEARLTGNEFLFEPAPELTATAEAIVQRLRSREMVIARMVHPSSERAALNWLETNSATLELLRLDTGKGLKLDKLYRLSDVLVKHHRTIENALFARQRKLFGAGGAVIFYDLTNTHMTGRPASRLARFGRSKQKRNDCPLVTLALATDEGGFPRRSSVLPGNVSEPGTLLDALDSLATQDEGEGKPTVIMDAGIATEDNLAELRKRGYHWITVKRGGVKPDQVDGVNARDPDATINTSSKHEVRVWRLSHDHENEAQLCIWSQARQEKDEAILAKKRERFEADLADLHKGLSKPRSTKKYDKVLERLGRLRERYALVNHHYDITVTKAPDGKARAVTWKRNAAYHTHNTRAGHYVLRTSHTEWSVEETVRTYWRLTELEATFQSLKSELGLRPVWHQLSKRIEGHLFIAVLALYGVNVIRTRLAAHGINHKWATLRTKLGRWQRTTIAATTTDGSRIEVRRDVRPDPTASAIAKAAGTPYMPQKRIRRLGKP